MDLRVKAYFILLLLLQELNNSAAAGEYHYRRYLGNLDTGRYKITLPDSMFDKINTDLSDIRVLGITNHGDTVQAPYIAEIAAKAENEVSAAFKIINQTHNASSYSYTFDVANQPPINRIELHLGEQNFDWKVSLYGSQDLQTWQPVIENYRIVAIKNQLTDYRFTTLLFPEAKYRYYRLQIPTAEKPNLLSANVFFLVLKPGIYNRYHTTVNNLQINTKDKTMAADLSLQQPVPVSYLKIEVGNNGMDYERPFALEYLSDSTKTEKGWVYNYTGLTRGILSSVEPNEFSFAPVTCKRLRLIIKNGDNPSLTIKSFIVQGYAYSLYTRISEPGKYYMFYGNTNAATPDYDIVKFQNKLPDSIQKLTPGYEEILPGTVVPQVHPLLENKIWLWAIMACIIILLGWFTFKMISGVGNNEQAK